jgi:hypothetical protein
MVDSDFAADYCTIDGHLFYSIESSRTANRKSIIFSDSNNQSFLLIEISEYI